jgi:hypothetical protein
VAGNRKLLIVWGKAAITSLNFTLRKVRKSRIDPILDQANARHVPRV